MTQLRQKLFTKSGNFCSQGNSIATAWQYAGKKPCY